MSLMQERLQMGIPEVEPQVDSGIITGSEESPAEIVSGRVVSIADNKQMKRLLAVVKTSIADGVVDEKERSRIDTVTSIVASQINGIDRNTEDPIDQLRLLRTRTQVLQDTTEVLLLQGVEIPFSAKLPLANYLREEDKIQEAIRHDKETKEEPKTLLGKVIRTVIAIPAVLLEP